MSRSPEHVVRILLVCLICLPLAVACRDNPVTAPPDDLRVRFPLRIDLGTLGGFTRSFATDINRTGTVVGWSDNVGGLSRAFRWTAWGGMTDLGTLPGDDWSSACCITDDGQILGTSGLSSVSTSTGTTVVWSSDGAITPLAIPLLPDATRGTVNDFNERGDFVGSDICGFGTCTGFTAQHAWFWNQAQGKFDISANFPGRGPEGAPSAVDGNGLVVGTHDASTGCWRARRPDCWRPFLWSHESGFRDLGTPWEGDTTAVAFANGMSEGPFVAGRAASFAVSGERAFVWTESEGFRILPLTGSRSTAWAVNNRGTVVGVDFVPTSKATAWRRSGGPITLSPDDPNSQTAIAVNDLDIVVGWSHQTDGGAHATLWLLGPANSALVALATGDAGKSAASLSVMSAAVAAADAAAIACLTDDDALISRGTLFACVARSATSR